MTNEYPDYKTYKKLYLRYYDGRDVAELLRLLEPLRGTRLLDLCAGEGQLTLKALEEGAREVVVVDAEPAMISPVLRQHQQVRVATMSVHDALNAMHARGESFERIACRQAVNYWLNEETARLSANILTPGGIFAFNTFNQKPSEKPRVLQYELEDHVFVEVSWLVGDTVHHLQVREGMMPHHTSFNWFPPELLREILEPYFVATEERHDKTSLYRCEKK